MTMKERMMAQFSRRTVQGVVRFLMELGAILFATVGIQLAFYFLDGPGFWCGCVQGVFLAGGYHAWKSAQNWNRQKMFICFDVGKEESIWVKSRKREDGTWEIVDTGVFVGKSNTGVHRTAHESTQEPGK